MAVKIAIVGLGGVGGFIGGSLARFYAGSQEVEIYFKARGETLRAVREKGLRVDTPMESFTARPAAVSDDVSSFGKVDYVLYCTKSYDVEQGIDQIRPCIGTQTVVVPFLNGVDGVEQIRRQLPGTEVWDGCVYIVARIESPGHIVENTGGYFYLFGSPSAAPGRLERLEGIFAAAGIKAYPAKDIEWQVWKKFGFISPLSTIMSYTDKTYGGILHDPQEKARLDALLAEFTAVARAKGVEMKENLAADVIRRAGRLPADATTSMERDFRAGHKTELEALTGYIVREGDRLGVPVPTYREMYDGLLGRL